MKWGVRPQGLAPLNRPPLRHARWGGSLEKKNIFIFCAKVTHVKNITKKIKVIKDNFLLK